MRNKKKIIVILVLGFICSGITLRPLLVAPLSYRCPPYIEWPINVVLYCFFSWGTMVLFLKKKNYFKQVTRGLLITVGIFLSALALLSVVGLVVGIINGEAFPNTAPEICRHLNLSSKTLIFTPNGILQYYVVRHRKGSRNGIDSTECIRWN